MVAKGPLCDNLECSFRVDGLCTKLLCPDRINVSVGFEEAQMFEDELWKFMKQFVKDHPNLPTMVVTSVLFQTSVNLSAYERQTRFRHISDAALGKDPAFA